jgi:hypothetical protein
LTTILQNAATILQYCASWTRLLTGKRMGKYVTSM